MWKSEIIRVRWGDQNWDTVISAETLSTGRQAGRKTGCRIFRRSLKTGITFAFHKLLRFYYHVLTNIKLVLFENSTYSVAVSFGTKNILNHVRFFR